MTKDTSTGARRVINCVAQLPFRTQARGADWQVEPTAGNSALHASLARLGDGWEQHVVGWTGEVGSADGEAPQYMTADERAAAAGRLQERAGGLQLHPVWLLRKDQARWRAYAENVLWPALHYILNPPSDGQQENTWWYDYVRFNEAYAMKVAQVYRPGDVVWVHDYQLMLLPQLLRMRFGDALIGYFHHSPWPSNEYFRCLPKRKELLDGLLGADRVCFQNEGFARHFVSSCKRLLGADASEEKGAAGTVYRISAYGGDVLVDCLPLGVDTKQLLEEAFTEDVDAKVQEIRRAYEGKHIIVGRDRLDAVRGVVQKLQAFEMFLTMYPEWKDKVVLIQVSSPTGMERDHRVEVQANELVNSINAQFGDLNFNPVQHYHMRIPKNVYYSLLRAADLCVVTSVRDGMSTTALEYVTVKSRSSSLSCYASPLVLSEFSGSSTILQDAMIVNPWDSVAVAKAIKKALSLSEEQKGKLERALWQHVPTVQDWTSKFLEGMLKLQDQKDAAEHKPSTKVTPALNRPLLLQNYQKAQRRLFLFDYDGTLTPIVQDPAAAIPSARLLSILRKLVSDPKNQIWIISGRDQKFLSRWLGDRMPQLGLSAEHGCFMKDVSNSEWINLASKFDMSWQIKVADIMEKYTEKTPGSFIERKKVALTWHYRRADPELAEYSAAELKKELEAIAGGLDLEVMEGKANLEVRPKFVNKGEIVKRLVWHPHGSNQTTEDEFKIDENVSKDKLPDFLLCLGDDFTDEDMFRQLNEIEHKWAEKFPNDRNEWGHYGIYPCTVGPASKKTVAKNHLTEPQQVLDTLGLLVGDVSLFQSAGTVDLDDRGHLKNSESSMKSERAGAAYAMKRSSSYKTDRN
ncbi:AaceriAGR132Wp [[Ashbya] aceris (nom. inval.)]|nr:AaceriAGR132Wp [[Ashbya] aceris (nom. inval.)]